MAVIIISFLDRNTVGTETFWKIQDDIESCTMVIKTQKHVFATEFIIFVSFN